ncbi:hypothetical protein [Synechococcus sp. PCC 6312]|uniref:hypothetical protein n=1 Tax=Synechococcus sp. (strain ATCC 27167 / PCC 6312) TaxID=195253 RepID=UPI0002FCD784
MITTSTLSQSQLKGEQRIILHDLAWDNYQQLLQSLPETRNLRLAYDRGTLEITMPLEAHEFTRELISLFIRVLVTEMGLKLKLWDQLPSPARI